MTDRTVLTAARLITGAAEPPVDEAALVVEGDRIVYAGPAAARPVVAGERGVDLGPRVLLPGFIDAHVHFGLDGSLGRFHALDTDPALQVHEAAARMSATLDAGVTTARDLGGISAGHRLAVERGLVRGPRLQVAVRLMSHTGGHGDFGVAGGEVRLAGDELAVIADSIDEVRRATRRLLRAGADLVKVATSGGMGSQHDDPDDEGLRIDEVRAVVDELDRHGGRPVAAHAQGVRGIHAAVLGGASSVEHGYGIDDAAIDMMGERGTVLVPTLATAFRPLDRERMPAFHYDKKSRWRDATMTNVAHAIEQGVRIAMGTDSGVGTHGRNLEELAHLVELGMSPMDAVIAATGSAARLLRLEDRGRLAPGLVADVVVSDVDPLRDVRGIGEPTAIAAVLQSGRPVKDPHRLFDPAPAGTRKEAA